jgi:hypothetical protein
LAFCSSTSSSLLGRPGDTGRGFGWAFPFICPFPSPRDSCLGMVMFRLHIPLPLKYPAPVWFLGGGIAETRKAPLIEGASFIFGAGQKALSAHTPFWESGLGWLFTPLSEAFPLSNHVIYRQHLNRAVPHLICKKGLNLGIIIGFYYCEESM